MIYATEDDRRKSEILDYKGREAGMALAGKLYQGQGWSQAFADVEPPGMSPQEFQVWVIGFGKGIVQGAAVAFTTADTGTVPGQDEVAWACRVPGKEATS